MRKKLVIYYSLDGNTAFLAKNIAEEIGADLLELQPKKPISSKGFTKFFWGGKQSVMKEKPELLPLGKNPADYDLIFFGTPIWAGNFNPAFRTLLNDIELQGKHCAFFCSCKDTGQKAFAALKQELAGNTILGEIEFRDALKNAETVGPKVKEWAREILTQIEDD